MELIPLPPELALSDEPFADIDVDRLAEWEATDPDERSAPPVARQWEADSDEAAEWAARKLSATVDTLQRVNEQAAEWRKRIDEWQDGMMRPHLARRDFFEGRLKDYALRVREASGGEIKTVPLPSATLSTRGPGKDSRGKVVVTDTEAFGGWARSTLDADQLDVVMPRKVSLTGVRSLVKVEEEPINFVLTCGCVVKMPADGFTTPEGKIDPFPGLSDGVMCPECSHEALIGAYAQVGATTVIDSVVWGVPGLSVEVDEPTASVKLVSWSLDAVTS